MANGGGGTNSNGFVKTGANGLGTNYGGAPSGTLGGGQYGAAGGDGGVLQQPGFNSTGGNVLGTNMGGGDYSGMPSAPMPGGGMGDVDASMGMSNSGVSTLPPSTGGPMPEAYPYPLGTPGAPSSSGQPLMNNGMPAPWDHEARTWQKIDRAFLNQGNRGLSGPALEAARQDMYQREMARIASSGGGFRQPPPRPQRPARTMPQNGLLGPAAPAAPAATGQPGRFGFGS